MIPELPARARVAWAALLIVGTSCSRDDSAGELGAAPASASASAVTSGIATAVSAAPASEPATAPARTVGNVSGPAPGGGRRGACDAPSLHAKGEQDGSSSDALGTCRFRPTGKERDARHCGRGNMRVPLDLERLEASVLLDDDARAHARALAGRGKDRGNSARTFALVGDSITLSDYFLAPFASGRRPLLSEGVAPRLALRGEERGGQSVIDWFRDAEPTAIRRKHRDSFRAPRAAKVGARADWPLIAGSRIPSPLAGVLDALDPSIAVVMLGTNDATWRVAPPEEIAGSLAADLARIVDLLEERGVVAVLTTLPRHGLQSELPRCGGSPASPSNWQLTVQTNAASAAVARLACERHLPLVDLRHALDGLSNHGLARDGIHPSVFAGGAGALTEPGLSCGYNVRNYVTLRMLAELEDAMR